MKTYNCGLFKYTLPDHACVFCKHCTDVFYDYSGGIYMLICDKENDVDGNISGKCREFEENNDETLH